MGQGCQGTLLAQLQAANTALQLASSQQLHALLLLLPYHLLDHAYCLAAVLQAVKGSSL
jgi:hypothetical protein